MISPEAKRAALDILGLFETGRSGGDPSAVTVLPDGAGISYGIAQFTERSGSLDAVLNEYAARGGVFAEQLRGHDIRALRAAGADPVMREADPVMREAQEAVLDRMYWNPAAERCEAMGLVLPLSWLAVLDTVVQSGPAAVDRMRRRFPELPPSRGGEERAWTRAYIDARLDYIATFEGRTPAHTATVRRTTYRAATLSSLASANNWELIRAKITIRGAAL